MSITPGWYSYSLDGSRWDDRLDSHEAAEAKAREWILAWGYKVPVFYTARVHDPLNATGNADLGRLIVKAFNEKTGAAGVADELSLHYLGAAVQSALHKFASIDLVTTDVREHKM